MELTDTIFEALRSAAAPPLAATIGAALRQYARGRWEEEKHPRDGDGKFSGDGDSGGSGGGSDDDDPFADLYSEPKRGGDRPSKAKAKSPDDHRRGELDAARELVARAKGAPKSERRAIARELVEKGRELEKETRRAVWADYRKAIDSFPWAKDRISRAVRRELIEAAKENGSTAGELFAGLASMLREGATADEFEQAIAEEERTIDDYPHDVRPPENVFRFAAEALGGGAEIERSVEILRRAYLEHLGEDPDADEWGDDRPRRFSRPAAVRRFIRRAHAVQYGQRQGKLFGSRQGSLWDEEKHPRDDDGKFASGGSSGSGSGGDADSHSAADRELRKTAARKIKSAWDDEKQERAEDFTDDDRAENDRIEDARAELRKRFEQPHRKRLDDAFEDAPERERKLETDEESGQRFPERLGRPLLKDGRAEYFYDRESGKLTKSVSAGLGKRDRIRTIDATPELFRAMNAIYRGRTIHPADWTPEDSDHPVGDAPDDWETDARAVPWRKQRAEKEEEIRRTAKREKWKTIEALPPGQGMSGFVGHLIAAKEGGRRKKKRRHAAADLRRTRVWRYGRWVTIGAKDATLASAKGPPREGKIGGSKVYIEDDGTITKGAASLEGKKVGQLGNDKAKTAPGRSNRFNPDADEPKPDRRLDESLRRTRRDPEELRHGRGGEFEGDEIVGREDAPEGLRKSLDRLPKPRPENSQPGPPPVSEDAAQERSQPGPPPVQPRPEDSKPGKPPISGDSPFENQMRHRERFYEVRNRLAVAFRGAQDVPVDHKKRKLTEGPKRSAEPVYSQPTGVGGGKTTVLVDKSGGYIWAIYTGKDGKPISAERAPYSPEAAAAARELGRIEGIAPEEYTAAADAERIEPPAPKQPKAPKQKAPREPKPPKEKAPPKLNPESKRGEALTRTAADYGVDPQHLATAADELYRLRSADAASREDAKQTLRKASGLTAGRIRQLENQGYDHTTTKLRAGLDVWGQEIARQFPELGWHPDDDDLAAKAWALMREGRQPAITRHDPDLIEDAARMLTSGGGSATFKQRADEPDWSTVEFARAGSPRRFSLEESIFSALKRQFCNRRPA